METWFAIKDFDYIVSNYGRIISLRMKRELNLRVSNSGYYRVTLYRNNIKKRMYIHRIIAEVFLENKNHYPQVNHKDANKLNNKVSNLEWCTVKENFKHATKHRLFANGSRAPKSKLEANQVYEIRRKYKSKKYSTYKLAKEYKVSQNAIWLIIKKTNWKYV